jgi:imidazolonepropionase-like amidohydrolase
MCVFCGEELTRRGFLAGATAAVAGVLTGNSLAQPGRNANLSAPEHKLHGLGLADHNLIERAKFHLFIWRLPVGTEEYTLQRLGNSIITHANLEYTYTQKKVSIRATLQSRTDFTPESFERKGTNFLGEQIDTSITFSQRSAVVRQADRTERVAVPKNFFTLDTPLPVSMQVALLRYWDSHGRPVGVSLLPSGEAAISHYGTDTILIGERKVQLDTFSIGGLTWGRTWLWFDRKQLIAIVTPNRDTSSQLQAIREGFEGALPEFLTKAAEHGMARLVSQAKRVSPQPQASLAIVGGTLVDGTGSPQLHNSAVVVQAGKIIAAGPRADIKIPPNATLINAEGKTVLPGLWDMHAHMRQVDWGPVYLAAGVTTVRDVGNDLESVTAMRQAINSGNGIGPRMLLAGFIDATDPSSVTGYHADTPDEARMLVDMYKWAGFDQIKVWNNIKPEILKGIATEAHRLGLTVTGHVPRAVNAVQAVEAGQDQINHVAFIVMSLPNRDLESAETKNFLQFFKNRGTIVDPTLSILELLTHSLETPVATFEPGINKVPPDVAAFLNKLGVPAAQVVGARSFFNLGIEVVRYLHKIGVPIVAGTDQVVPGHSLHRELELYVKAGFTPMEAIQAATIVPARVMNIDQEVGTIEAGKRADLIITAGNPLDDISHIRKVTQVIWNGIQYRATDLWRIAGFRA